MTFSVYGMRPTSQVGVCFEASDWEWGAIHKLFAQLCPDLVEYEVLWKLGYHQGVGVDDPVACRVVGRRFASWLVDFRDEEFHVYDERAEKLMREGPKALSKEELEGLSCAPIHGISYRRLGDWIRFLYCAGGFAVW